MVAEIPRIFIYNCICKSVSAICIDYNKCYTSFDVIYLIF